MDSPRPGASPAEVRREPCRRPAAVGRILERYCYRVPESAATDAASGGPRHLLLENVPALLQQATALR